jgi:hypothetical protein
MPGALAVALFAPALETAVYDGVSDFKWHARTASDWAAGRPLATPHFLFHALLVGAAEVLPAVDWTQRAVLLALACQGILAIVLTAALRPAIPPSLGRARIAAAGLLSLALLVAAPVTVGSWSERNLYHGYVGLAVYHNPTLFLLKPLAGLLWWEVARALGGAARPPALLAVLTFASAFAKPSHLIALLPAAAGLAVLFARTGRPPAWRPLWLGLGVPAVIALAWQFAFRYGGGGVSVEWAPLVAMAHRDAHLGARLVLSALFPLAVLVSFPRAIGRDVGLALAAATFAFGAGYAYLLAESGDTLGHRNFAWSAQAALFVWFVAATRTFLCEARGESGGKRLRLAACGAALAMHVVCGIYFYRHPTWW